VEDFATLNFRAGDVNCHIELAWAHSHGPQGNLLSTDIFASKGGVRCRASWSNDGPPLTVFRRGAADQVSEKIINFTPADAHHEQDKHFIDSIRSERAPEYTPELALKVMEIIEMVYQQNGIEMCNGSSQLAAPTLMLND
jgi:predicted dehydrogenase